VPGLAGVTRRHAEIVAASGSAVGLAAPPSVREVKETPSWLVTQTAKFPGSLQWLRVRKEGEHGAMTAMPNSVGESGEGDGDPGGAGRDRVGDSRGLAPAGHQGCLDRAWGLICDLASQSPKTPPTQAAAAYSALRHDVK